MRVLGILAAVAAAASALGQALLCPPPARPTCDTFHYHVQRFRPDTRGFIEFSGINRFATKTECERARDAAVEYNAAVVKRSRDAKYQPDQFGPCHCDTSDEYLTDLARSARLRLYGGALMRVRERMLPDALPPPIVRAASPLD